MIFSSNHTNQILSKQSEIKRGTIDKIESKQSLIERKELRVKKFDFDSKIQTNDDLQKELAIKNLIDQHEKIDSNIINHYKKECIQQEDQFQKKMRERKDRSVGRSLSKSVEAGPHVKRQHNQEAFGGNGKEYDFKKFETGLLKIFTSEKKDDVLNELDLNAKDQKKQSDNVDITGLKKDDMQNNENVKNESKNDTFSIMKMNALSAKLHKMKMFNQEFEAKNGEGVKSDIKLTGINKK